MAVVVIDEPQLIVVNFGRELERVRGSGGAGGRSRGDGAEGRVIVGRRHVPVEIHELADVFRQVHGREIEVVAEDVDRERARRGRFFGIPEDHALERKTFRSLGVRRNVERGDLQIAVVNITFVQRDRSRDRHFFLEAPSLRVVAAFDDGLRRRVFETDRAVFAVVGDRPRSRGGADERLRCTSVRYCLMAYIVFP